MKKSYFSITWFFILMSLFCLFFIVIFVSTLILYYNGIMKSAAIWVFGPMTLFISVQYLRICAYPVVSDNSIAIKWLFFPFIRRQFTYQEVRRVVFKRKVSYGNHYTMKIAPHHGKDLRLMDMICMPVGKLGDLIEDLRAHGVEVDNQLRITDIP